MSPPGKTTRRFARDLVRQLGFQAAVDACRRNVWDGVLHAIHWQHRHQ